MGQKDIAEKILEDYNDVFADIINGLLFDGVQEIKPEAHYRISRRYAADRRQRCGRKGTQMVNTVTRKCSVVSA